MKSHPYPTARDARTSFCLAVNVGDQRITGDNVPEFLCAVLNFIDKHNALAELTLPFCTSGKNFLLAASPEQKNGRPFPAYRRFEGKDRTTHFYINTNHPRFFALRQGARLLEATGFTVSYDL
ncbi:hypothetical protein [Neokomagataea thailandica]|uniref:Uncharacterized protein n=1 Tax=Neokomagataea tanensis NBRC 106556 TaxID=1223519 RepID=A0ABQ0QHM2_9PROT|nr:hypothetical protein [Neokomagataea thailandica]GBR45088.1 hypothetical protein AA106556_0648 [Neokomagataea tanensis NBRC 106556]